MSGGVKSLKKLLASLFVIAVFANFVFAFSQKTEGELKDAIKNEYQKEFPTILISDIKIEHTTKEDFGNLRYKAMEMQKQNLQKDSGVVLAIFEGDKNSTKRLFVRYKIEALLEIVKAKYNLQKDKIIDLDDVLADNVPFKNFYSKPISKESLKGLAAKRFMTAGSIIFEKDVGRSATLKKNSSSYATMKMDGLEIELEVVALEDGNIGETINVKTKNGKTMKAYLNKDGRLEIR